LLILACGPGADEGAGEPVARPTPADAAAIRQFDLEQAPAVQNTLRQLGGGDIVPAEVVYADLTGDQREEAVVPVSSGGTLGNVAYLVLSLRNGQPEAILNRTVDRSSAGSGLRMTLEEGKLVETVGVFGPEDPFCCPSMLRKTTFRWDGSRLQVEGEQLVQAPNAPKR
jgi:hypothetical protein